MYSNGYVPAWGVGSGDHDGYNPWVSATQTGFNESWQNNIQATLEFIQKLDFITKGLKFTFRFGYDTYNSNWIKRRKWPAQYKAQPRFRDENGNLNIVTTRQILHYSYRALEASSPTLIYGYTVEDVQQSGKTLYQLLVPAQEQSEGTSINNVRLMYGSVDRVLHLPGTCIAAKLGTKSVYGFSANAVYACRFGETTFRAYAMPINVTAVLGMMTDNRAVVASGSEIYVVELPT